MQHTARGRQFEAAARHRDVALARQHRSVDVPNASVGHAASVQASISFVTSLFPERVNTPEHTLQSTRVEKRPSVKARV